MNASFMSSSGKRENDDSKMNFQDGNLRRFPNPDEITEMSSLGILSFNDMHSMINTTAADKSEILNVSQLIKERQDVFKVPLVPPEGSVIPSKSVDASMALPESLLIPKFPPEPTSIKRPELLGDTFMSTDVSGSFAWDKILQDDADKSGREIPNLPSLGLSFRRTEADFTSLNNENSFFQGQISARSTSIGGSSTGRKNQRTVDEDFSDFSQAENIFAQNATPEPNSLQNWSQNDNEFMMMQQQVGDMSGEKFSGSNGKAIMDAAEQDFNEEHQFDLEKVPSSASLISFTSLSVKDSTKTISKNGHSDVSSDELLTKSGLFGMYTSRLGSLDSTVSEEGRPNFGLSTLASPRKQTRQDSGKPFSTNSTYTVTSSDPSASSIKVDNTMEDIAEAHRLSIIEGSQSANNKANLTSFSQFLPSFLETSLDVTNEAKNSCDSDSEKSDSNFLQTATNQQAKTTSKEGKKLLPSPVSKIPRPVPVKQGGNVVRGRRFSSPIKEKSAQPHDTSAKTKRKLFKENIVPKAPSAETSSISKDGAYFTSMPPKKPLTVNNSVGNKEVVTKKNVKYALPVQADKQKLTWVGVGLEEPEKQILILKNTSDGPIDLYLRIKPEASNFKLSATVPKEITIASKKTKEISVIFIPSNNALVKGSLVIKRKGRMNETGNTFKATIPLEGQGGSPAFRLEGFGDYFNERRTFDFGMLTKSRSLNCQWKIHNDGNADGFYKMQAYRDPDCRQIDDGIIISPSYGILKPNETQNVTVVLSKRDRSSHLKNLATVALFYGSEITRQVMIKARSLPGAQRFDSFHALLCVDFAHPFSDTHSVHGYLGSVRGEDVAHFYQKTHKEIIDFVGKEQGDMSALFNELAIEETLNESRMNYTVLEDKHRQVYNTISEEPELPAAAAAAVNKKPHKSPIQSVKKTIQNSKRTVYFECDIINFPLVRIGQRSVTKIKVKNRTKSKQMITLEGFTPPFSSKMVNFEINKLSYFVVPLYYVPEKNGKHQISITLSCKAVNVAMTAKLIGSTMSGP